MFLTAAELVADARRLIGEFESPSFNAQTRGRLLIDVREPAEFGTGPIAGASHILRGVLELQVDAHPAVADASRTSGRSAAGRALTMG